MSKLHGILPALVTPVNDAGEFQSKPYEQLLERMYGAGVHGIYVCGQTGEGFQLQNKERRAAVECAVQNSPDGANVVVHVGAPSTAEAVGLAKHAAEAGAHYVSSLPPVGGYSFEEVKAYYAAIAQASALPLLIYYFPTLSAAIKTTEQVLELCEMPNVVGLKFTDSDFFRLWAIRQSGAVVFNGSDEMLVSGLIAGANGGIGSTYNLMAASFVKMYTETADGNWEAARQTQSEINELIQVLLLYPVNTVIKQVLQWTGLDCGPCILPRRKLNAAEQKNLRERMMQTTLGSQLLTTDNS